MSICEIKLSDYLIEESIITEFTKDDLESLILWIQDDCPDFEIMCEHCFNETIVGDPDENGECSCGESHFSHGIDYSNLGNNYVECIRVRDKEPKKVPQFILQVASYGIDDREQEKEFYKLEEILGKMNEWSDKK